jgi:hypothetical protein
MVERRVLIETETSVMVRLIVTTAVVGTRRVILRVATFVCSRVVVFSRVLVRSNVSVLVGPSKVFSIVGPGTVFSIVGPGGPETVFVTDTKSVRVIVRNISER